MGGVDVGEVTLIESLAFADLAHLDILQKIERAIGDAFGRALEVLHDLRGRRPALRRLGARSAGYRLARAIRRADTGLLAANIPDSLSCLVGYIVQAATRLIQQKEGLREVYRRWRARRRIAIEDI